MYTEIHAERKWDRERGASRRSWLALLSHPPPSSGHDRAHAVAVHAPPAPQRVCSPLRPLEVLRPTDVQHGLVPPGLTTAAPRLDFLGFLGG